jgi:hypothetical protein
LTLVIPLAPRDLCLFIPPDRPPFVLIFALLSINDTTTTTSHLFRNNFFFQPTTKTTTSSFFIQLNFKLTFNSRSLIIGICSSVDRPLAVNFTFIDNFKLTLRGWRG